MPAIEYHVENTNGYVMSAERLNQLGAEGWQLIQMIGDAAYFSRPVQPKPVEKKTRKRTTKN